MENSSQNALLEGLPAPPQSPSQSPSRSAIFLSEWQVPLSLIDVLPLEAPTTNSLGFSGDCVYVFSSSSKVESKAHAREKWPKKKKTFGPPSSPGTISPKCLFLVGVSLPDRTPPL